MDKKVKQKQAGRWDEYVQKTKQVKETATGSLDAPKSAWHKRETRLCYTGWKMPDNKITDNRCRRYIRITDEESWRMIDEIATHDGYNSFNKIINDALFYGLPILRDKVVGGTVTEEERNSLMQPRTSGSTKEEFYAVLTRLLKETVMNIAINKSILSSLFNFISETSQDEKIIKKLNDGLLADTPEYLEQFEADGIKNLRK